MDNIQQFIDKGYHKFLGIDEEKFLNLIPEKQKLQDKIFARALLVIPPSMIKVEKQILLSGIEPKVDLTKISSIKTKEKPYWIYFQDGSKNRGKSPSFCRKNLSKKERGLTLVEGISLYIQYPSILDKQSVDLIGSTYGKECTPTIYKWAGKVMISAICSDISDAMCGSATCIKEDYIKKNKNLFK
ncbi:MAG: DUF5701 family protein [Candidatus Nanoarchaeia archaeon]|nr:DUF5701 family protein [Candidatus Nanoarchaeia archaeon]